MLVFVHDDTMTSTYLVEHARHKTDGHDDSPNGVNKQEAPPVHSSDPRWRPVVPGAVCSRAASSRGRKTGRRKTKPQRLHRSTRRLASMSSRFFRAISDSESDSSSEEEELLSDEEQTQTKRSTRKLDDSDDDSDESDESDSDDDSDDSDDNAPQQTRKPMSRFMRDVSSDSESEEEVRKVIKSAKDKRLDEFEAVIHNVENAQRIDDWITISKGTYKFAFNIHRI